MLTLTENATEVVKRIADQTPDVAGLGLRIAAASMDSTELNLSVVAQPEVADDVVENGGARVFLEPVASGMLDDKILDAHIADNGSVSFEIGMQPSTGA